jgi:pyruvate dehydrogenase E2 component (dihydrolipoamide acetyltransferase)
MADVEVRVPNIGDFSDVPVIEILVKPGDVVKAEDPLITLESEKAAMEVPSPSAGKVQAVTVKVGDKVSEGTPILTLASDAAQAQAPPAQPQAPPAPNGQAKASASSVAPSPSTELRTGSASATPVILSEGAREASAAVEGPSTRTMDVTVPDIGDFSDIPVIEVLVKPGDKIEKESPLVTLESEKSSMEVPSPEAGVVKDVALKIGDKVSKGTKILTLSVNTAAPPANVILSGAPAGSGVEGPPEKPPSAGGPSTGLGVTKPELAVSSPTPAPAPSGAAVHASPSIRKFARELGVALSGVAGTGPKGRITREDVQSFVKRALAAPRATGSGWPFDLPPWPKVDFAKFGAIERKPLSRIKKLSGPNLARNWVMIPHVTNHDDADITDLEKFRQELNAENPNVKITMLAFLIKAVISALEHFPDVNASLDGDELVLKKYYHIGFAADTPNGLLVPVVKDADKKGLLQIAAETRDLAAKARDGKLGLGDMQGASFTISSLGGIGGTGFTPIINAPEVAILGVSRSSMRPCWDGKQFVPRLILPLSLSYDHRVIDGAQAARFNAQLANVLGDMRRAML